jgi:thiamine monophosphate kinase
LDLLDEKRKLQSILGKPPRSSRQKNKIFESDVEILKLALRSYLGISTDSVAEEISIGLYEDPETWAWLSVMSSVSDLAASGCRPLGLLMATQWGQKILLQQKKRFSKSLNQACKKADVPFLGGDTGHDRDSSFTATIIGNSDQMPLTRMGAGPGDFLFLAHDQKVGWGPLLSLSVLFDWPEKNSIEQKFRPVPDWRRTVRLKARIAASIDTSDGVTGAAATLASLNGLGLTLDFSEKSISKEVLRVGARHHIAPELLWMIDLGDLQTLFVVKPQHKSFFEKQKGLSCIGQFKRERTFLLKSGKASHKLPLKRILMSGKSIKDYQKLFKDLNQQWSGRNII